MQNTNQTIIRRISTTAISAALLTMLVGCGGEFNEVETPETCSAEQAVCEEVNTFVSVQELEFLRQNSDPIILDARPNEGDFLNRHIPGAYHAQWGEHRDGDAYNKLWEDDEQLEEFIQDRGVEADRTVLVYGAGDGSGGDSVAGNLYWTLDYVGHDDVYLVDGGLAAWIDAEYDVVGTGENDPPTTDFEIERNEELNATIDDLQDAIGDDDTVIIDTRRESEWLGDEERDGTPETGHIPEAVHYHWEDLLEGGENGEGATLRPHDELRAEFDDLGFDDAETTLPYCQSGVRSGYFYAVLKELDYSNPVNYDGSWFEWANEYEGDDEYIIVPDEE